MLIAPRFGQSDKIAADKLHYMLLKMLQKQMKKMLTEYLNDKNSILKQRPFEMF